MKRSVVALALSLSLGGVSCTGTKGDTGPAGAAGAAGPAGVAGPAGAAGAPGATGSPGATGAAGPAGEQGAPGATGAVGAMGSMGVAGLDGQSVQVTALDAGTQCAGGGALLTSADGGTAVVCNGTPADAYLYGDGSAGALTISTDTDWTVTTPDNLNFASITISAGATLTVPSGLKLRVTGAFTNNGTIVVRPWGGGGQVQYFDEAEPDAGTPRWTLARATVPGQGIALSSSENGPRTRVRVVPGVTPGRPRSPFMLSRLVDLGVEGGGGGGGCGIGSLGGSGGGTLTVLARLAITNVGAIEADGETPFGRDCAGGGGGGVVLLASAAAINNGGTVSVKGGTGYNNGIAQGCSPGGGGGGGLIHFIAPTVAATGTADVSGGQGGALYSFPQPAISDMGGAGGTSAGLGGHGAELTGALGWGGLANDGLTITTLRSPTALFL